MPDEVRSKPADSGGDEAALSALKRMARPQPKPFDAPGTGGTGGAGGAGGAGTSQDMPLSAGSATGFVGSLAKPAGEPLPGDSMAGAKPPIEMAKEVVPRRPASPLAAIAKAAEEVKAVQPAGDSPVNVPRGSAGMAYAMMVIAVVLLIIGSWAVGALMYMRSFQPLSPRDVAYPLISWQIDMEKGGSYARTSVAMAWAMLLCLPVSVILLVMGWKLLPRRAAVPPA
jgi:hypothetical protein